MKLNKLRWSRVYESSEEELVDLLHTKNITATRHHADELTDIIYDNVSHDTTWWCADGSMTIVSDSGELSLQAGDFVCIPSGDVLTATAGITGCTYYES